MYTRQANFKKAWTYPPSVSPAQSIMSGGWDRMQKSDRVWRQYRFEWHNAKLNDFEQSLAMARLNNVLKKVARWFWQGDFRYDYYCLPRGLRDVKEWALFYSTSWIRDKTEENVKFFDNHEEALAFAETQRSGVHSIMLTTSGQERQIVFKAHFGEFIEYCPSCDSISLYSHKKDCVELNGSNG